jgi:hypothetical protein
MKTLKSNLYEELEDAEGQVTKVSDALCLEASNWQLQKAHYLWLPESIQSKKHIIAH